MKKLIEKLIQPFTLATLMVIIIQIMDNRNPNSFQALGFIFVIITSILISLFLYFNKDSNK